MSGVVRKIGIHLEDERILARERPLEARQIGSPEPHLFCTVQRVHARIRNGDFIDDGASAIRRSVIDDQHAEPRVLRQHRLNDTRDIFALVVRRNDDEAKLVLLCGLAARR